MRFVFEGAMRKLPNPEVEKDNVNYLAGVREIGPVRQRVYGRSRYAPAVDPVSGIRRAVLRVLATGGTSEHIHRFRPKGRFARVCAGDRSRSFANVPTGRHHAAMMSSADGRVPQVGDAGRQTRKTALRIPLTRINSRGISRPSVYSLRTGNFTKHRRDS